MPIKSRFLFKEDPPLSWSESLLLSDVDMEIYFWHSEDALYWDLWIIIGKQELPSELTRFSVSGDKDLIPRLNFT